MEAWYYRFIYSISQEICTRFCCALLCCGYAIVHNEFTWSIYPYSSGLQCQWSKPDGYGKISQCITTTKHSKAKTVCIFLGIYCSVHLFHISSDNCNCWEMSFAIIYIYMNMVFEILSEDAGSQCVYSYSIQPPLCFGAILYEWRQGRNHAKDAESIVTCV